MSPLSVPHFSPIRVRIRVLRRILPSVRNEEDEEKKTKKLKRNFVRVFHLFFYHFQLSSYCKVESILLPYN